MVLVLLYKYRLLFLLMSKYNVTVYKWTLSLFLFLEAKELIICLN